MSLQYTAVGWNRQKRVYDSVLGCLAGGYLALFTALGALFHPIATAETLLIRGLGTLALLMLHVILCIGPLCRLDPRFLPLLYNRRHLGVSMFLVALAHGAFSLVQFHALGDVSPPVSLLLSNTRYGSLAQFPFQPLGAAALLVLFLMAATSHDFWLRNLSAPVWKRLHMAVYLAYALLIGHVALGALQSEPSLLLAGFLAVGMTLVIGLHLAAGWKEHKLDTARTLAQADGFVDVCDVQAVPENRARIVSLSGERVAIFRYDDRVSAVSNVCQHQNGPLGEGRVIDGCITCPWHGYQYLPDTGASPPPFTEKVPVFRTQVIGQRVLVHPQPLPAGQRVAPACITACGSKERS
ncbi:MAG: ferric reductase-like transmembrane domain-containing protein [Acidobacteria bacterium]|nr:ferric reductase-like transmembrane domain-containing protein [Acidobacteriota bacterium]